MALKLATLGKSHEVVEDIDLESLDDLLAQLTTEEIEELNGDFDPDNDMLPASQRSRDQTDKDPTGPFNRKKLLDFLEKTAKAEKDWDQNKEFVSEARGKKFVAKGKVEEKLDLGKAEGEDVETEWDEILKQASEEELVDLAAVLGFHGMLNQVQYHASLQDEKVVDSEAGFHGCAKPQILKAVAFEPPNPTDVEESIEKLKSNDTGLKDLNLNNISNISIERLIEVCEGLKTNTQLKILQMANTAMTDKVAKALAEALDENKTLRVINVESNYISGEMIVELLKGINKNMNVVELRVANQKPSVLGNKVETQITKLILDNNEILRFGIFFEFPDARIRVNEKLKSNNDTLRKDRLLKKKVTTDKS